jgi:acyl-CoA thioesterase I
MNILIFGDSITWGACDNERGGWATRLRNNLATEGVDVYNCGISDDDTDALLNRFLVEAQARMSEEKTVIIFAIGTNDSQYTGDRDNTRVPQDKFVANLELLIEQAEKLSAQVMFIGLSHVEEEKVMPIPWSDGDKNYDNTSIDIYNSLLKDISYKYELPFLDIANLLEFTDLVGGVHPSTEGHKKMFETVKEFLVAERVLQ